MKPRFGDWMPIIIIVLVFVMAVLSVAWDQRVRSACYAHGFPERRMAMGTAYCVKRVNQTDVVVCLDSLR